jgi:hypothetical protein
MRDYPEFPSDDARPYAIATPPNSVAKILSSAQIPNERQACAEVKNANGVAVRHALGIYQLCLYEQQM